MILGKRNILDWMLAEHNKAEALVLQTPGFPFAYDILGEGKKNR